jgi:hypothetical protein
MEGCPLLITLLFTLKLLALLKKLLILIKKPPFSVNVLKKLGQTVKL